jgi:uncharacterized protein YkwD
VATNAVEFNWIDLLLALLVLLSAWGGWRRGFVLASLELLTLLASLLLALLGWRYPAAWIEGQWPWLGVWVAPLSFAALFLLAHLLLGSITGRLTSATPRQVHVHGMNRALGLLPGLGNGLVNATVVTLLLVTLPIFDGLSRTVRDSQLASRLSPAVEWVEARFSDIFEPAIQRSLQVRVVRPDSSERIDLPFKVTQARPRPDLESRMLALVNAERASQGLRPVKADPDLVEVARAHSRDMLARGYFSHYTPEGSDLGDRLRRERVSYLVAGENLAFAQTLTTAHQGLMNSPGHRANILRPQFGRLGIGVLDAGAYGLMVTQNFRN